MLFCKYIFFISAIIFLYNYFGYAIIAYLYNKLIFSYKSIFNPNFYPTVSFIVAAYNEDTIIENKLINSLQQEYPQEKIEFIFVTDGSSDNTSQIVSRFSVVNLLHNTERKGKSAAVNRAVAAASNDIIIMSDANTILNKEAVANISRHYYDKKVGGVAGEKKVLPSVNEKNDVGETEGLYWKYESFLKKIDSGFYSVVGAAGELFSVRRSLYQPLPENIILDDFVLSLRVAGEGYRIVYEPAAFAMELASASVTEERKRKIRIAAGGFQAMRILFPLLYFWRHFKLTYLYFSHRVLRWTLSPLCLLLMLVSSFFLAFFSNILFYKIIFLLQAIFYCTAAFSKQISSTSKLKFLKTAGYFSFMNVSVFQGFFRYILKKQSSVWEKAKRSV